VRVGRTVPPVAAPIDAIDLWCGATGLLRPARALQRFEDEIRRIFDVRHVFLLSSGTAALTVALKALASTSDRIDVILPAYTCFTVPAAVVQAGLRPVLCDLGENTLDFDYVQLARLVNRRTLAVIVHHLFGMRSDVARARRVCAAHGAFVVEDAAQAMGVEAQGRMLGTIGDVGIFSLGRGKCVTCGEGGIIVSQDARIASAIERQYRSAPAAGIGDAVAGFVKTVLMCAFIRPSLYWIPAGLPFLKLGETTYPTRVVVRRLSGMHAGLMRRMRSRMALARRVRAGTAADLQRRLRVLPRPEADRHPYLRLPVYAATPEDRARLLAISKRRGLGLAPGYPSAVSEIPELRNQLCGRRFPRATRVSQHLLTLPTHHWLAETDTQAIVGHVSGVVERCCPPEVDTMFHRERALAPPPVSSFEIRSPHRRAEG
jgi:dTDP-4-amino-4,6-dideoxygalactose transaminase